MPSIWSKSVKYSLNQTHNANCRVLILKDATFSFIGIYVKYIWTLACLWNLILSTLGKVLIAFSNVCHYFLCERLGIYLLRRLLGLRLSLFLLHRTGAGEEYGINCGNYKRKAFTLTYYRKQDFLVAHLQPPQLFLCSLVIWPKKCSQLKVQCKSGRRRCSFKGLLPYSCPIIQLRFLSCPFACHN